MTAADPVVSVIVPVRDRRALLRRTLDALAAQTLTAHEVVVVDDGSTDGSADEAEADRRAGRPVRLVRGDGRGAVAARTIGVAAATAPLLAFTDSDCEPDPGWLAAGVTTLEAGADAVQGVTRPVRPAGPLERTVWVTFEDGLYATCNMFYRRDAFEAAGGFDPAVADRLGFRPDPTSQRLGFAEDTLLGWRVRRAGTLVFAPEAVVRHHVFPFDPVELVRRSWSVAAFPALVRELPELRRLLLRDGVFLGRRTRLPIYAAAGAALTGRRRLAAVALATAAVVRWPRLCRSEPSLRRRLLTVPVDTAADALSAVALVAGSVRARTPVL